MMRMCRWRIFPPAYARTSTPLVRRTRNCVFGSTSCTVPSSSKNASLAKKFSFSGDVQNKKPGFPGLGAKSAGVAARSQRLYVRRRGALRAAGHIEGDFLRLLERLEPGHLDRRVMSKEILAAVIGRNEAEALRVVEPLHRACCHLVVSFLRLRDQSEPRLRA